MISHRFFPVMSLCTPIDELQAKFSKLRNQESTQWAAMVKLSAHQLICTLLSAMTIKPVMVSMGTLLFTKATGAIL